MTSYTMILFVMEMDLLETDDRDLLSLFSNGQKRMSEQSFLFCHRIFKVIYLCMHRTIGGFTNYSYYIACMFVYTIIL